MLKNIRSIYFLGVGGIGMSALASWMKIKGFEVHGWDDNKNTPIVHELNKKGIAVYDNYSKNKLVQFLSKLNTSRTVLIYTPAISKQHAIFKLFKAKKIKCYKRAELLRYISMQYRVVAIAGTHGKTTISIMLSHILYSSGIDCSAFFGGISKNYSSNFMVGESEIMVIEADEYDNSFLQLNPEISLISSLDKDHGDIYDTYDEMIKSYNKFMDKTKRHIVGNKKLKHDFDYTYSIKNKSHFYASDIKYDSNKLYFKVHFPDKSLVKTYIHFGSYYNVENAVGAASLAYLLGIQPDKIGRAISTFKGVGRRFEYHLINKELIFIDDYAHHPEELRALITNVRNIHFNKEIFLIFQPHLFSRTQEFETEFVNVLSLVDRLVLLDIYPAREQPIPNINSQKLLSQIDVTSKWHINKETDLDKLSNLIQSHPPELLITAGAGDIYRLVPFLKSILKKVLNK
ncbi:MAG: UDP-N-acetylmuramate--L-alanine ligase [Flavobacteriales bacterium]|nr:UDP-N-acetylmuramate--L-alanine ligase [Flavobacteriales bacterium]|tara:strand:+ start:1993 stop:3366 length:1374 start_codon:yes stop_codon:yes gene_type:complete